MGFWKAKAYGSKKSQFLDLFVSISWFYLFNKSEEKESYFEGVKKSRLENYPNFLLVMLGYENPNSSINVFSVGLSWVIWFF